MAVKPKSDPNDSWEPTSGLVDRAEVTVINSEFGYDKEYQDGKTLVLIWKVESPDEPEFTKVLWSCGKYWDSAKGGAVAVKEGKLKFQKSSFVSLLAQRCFELGIEADLRERGQLFEAGLWIGWHGVLEREDFKFPGLSDDPVPHLIPVDFIDWAENGAKSTKAGNGDGKTETAAAKAKRLKKEAAAKKAAEEAAAGDGDEGLEDKLIALAKEVDDRDDFQSQALDVGGEELEGNQSLLEDVLDDSKDGLWSRARAD